MLSKEKYFSVFHVIQIEIVQKALQDYLENMK